LENPLNLENIPTRPFVEGIIRIATQPHAEGEKITFNGSMEVLSRHHIERAPDTLEIPRLAQHPMGQTLMKEHANEKAAKLVEIPIRMFFGKAENALTAAYQAYDAQGKPACRGNGDTAKRQSYGQDPAVSAVIDVPCSGPSHCEMVQSGKVRCQRQVCMTVQIEGQDNPLSTFEVRSSSYNTYKTLKGQLEFIEKRFGGLRHVPLKLQTWQTSNQASDYETFDAFKLALGTSREIDAMKMAKEARKEEIEAGLGDDIDATYEAHIQGFGEDDFDIVTDFYAPVASHGSTNRRQGVSSIVSQLVEGGRSSSTGLAENIIAQAMARAGVAADAVES
jgi:hypothetical protein